MPSHYGKKSPTKHFGGSHKNNPESVVSPGDEEVFAKWGRHSHAASEGKSSKRIKSPTEYAPFKMKHAGSSPMHKNFPAAFKQVDDIENPVAGASPMQKPLVGKQKNLPEHLKKEILEAPVKQLDDKEKGKKIVRKMKQIEAKLTKNGNLSEEKKKKLKDELLKLSTTIRGQEYTDTGK